MPIINTTEDLLRLLDENEQFLQRCATRYSLRNFSECRSG